MSLADFVEQLEKHVCWSWLIANHQIATEAIKLWLDEGKYGLALDWHVK